MSNPEHFKQIKVRYIPLDGDRYVGVADLENTNNPGVVASKGLIFQNSDGRKTRIRLTLEAYAALMLLQNDMSQGMSFDELPDQYKPTKEGRWVVKDLNHPDNLDPVTQIA